MKRTKIILVLALITTLFIFGCTSQNVVTFKDSGVPICTVEGKPVVQLFSTTWCPHCNWIGPTYDKVVTEYVDKNLILAYHWQVDILDDILTDINEASFPEDKYTEFKRVSPAGSIPAYSFGCKYTRIGNGYEQQNDLTAEEKEFRSVIDLLIAEAKK